VGQGGLMTPKQRFMKALNLEEPDQVPFADWVKTALQLSAKLKM
jgi:hypothetical protein